MAWYETLYGGGSGDTTVQPVLLGNFSSTVTTAVTRTLSQSLDNFKYIWFSLYPITSDSVWMCDAPTNGGYAFSDVEYFKTHSLTLHYVTGSSGSTVNFRTMIVTYVDGTTITSQANNTTPRNLYVYGIKDMPHGHWNETVLWTNSSPTSDFANQAVTLSDNISNYDYIEIDYLIHKSNSSKSSVVYKSEDILNWQNNSTTTTYIAYGALGGCSTADQKRSIMYNGANSIYFNRAVGWNNTTAANSCLIPTAIIGLKFS